MRILNILTTGFEISPLSIQRWWSHKNWSKNFARSLASFSLDSSVLYTETWNSWSGRIKGSLDLMELLVKEKAQDPLVADQLTSRPIFASVMGYRRNLVDTCKSTVIVCW